MICKSGLAVPKLHQTASWRREISAVHASHKRNWYGEAKWQYFPRFPFLLLFSAVLLLNLCAIDNLNSRHMVKPSLEVKISSRLWISNFSATIILATWPSAFIPLICWLPTTFQSSAAFNADEASACKWQNAEAERRNGIFCVKHLHNFLILCMHASRQLRTVRLLM